MRGSVLLILLLASHPAGAWAAKPTEDQRAWFLAGQALLGLSLYSWGVPTSLGLTEDAALGVGLMTPPAWFGISFLQSTHPISAGEAYGAFAGGITGFLQGAYLFGSPRGGAPVSIAENLLDRWLARKKGLRPADIQRKANRSLFGFYHLTALYFLLGGSAFGTDQARAAAALSLLEGYIPLMTARGADPHATFGDALMELRYGVLGAEALPLLLLTADLLDDGEAGIDRRVYWGLSLAGHLAALPLGRKMTQNYDLSFGGAVVNFLLPALVHGFTAGVGVLSGNEGYWRFYPAIFLLTDATLTLFLHRHLAQKARVKNSSLSFILFCAWQRRSRP